METANMGLLAGSEIHGFHTLEDLDLDKIKEEATKRWLRSNEIHAILCNYTYFNIKVKPVELPEGGTIVLFDRKMLRNFRKDCHNWKKKKDGKTVKEAHEHLKVGDLDRIHVYYAHGEDNPNFVRRIYWLLDKKHEHIVLVHYRKVLEDGAVQAHGTPKECREALSLSTRTQFGSPFIHVNSGSDSLNSEMSGSRVLSEEADSVVDRTFCAASSTSPLSETTELGNQHGESVVTDHELRLHEINTLDWADLLENHDPAVSAAPIRDEVSCFDQQSGCNITGSANYGSLEPVHNLLENISSFGDPTHTNSGNNSIGNNQSTGAYFLPMGHQDIQLPLEADETVGMFEKNVFQTQDRHQDFQSALGADETVGMFEKNALETQDSFRIWMKYVVNESPGQLEGLPLDSLVSANHQSGEVVAMNESSLPEKLLDITDVSPPWAFSTEDTKVIVIGKFHEEYAHLATSNLFCVFGDACAPAEMVQVGVFRCMTRPHIPGLVNFYLTLDGVTPISQVLNFEYRSFPSSQMNNGTAAREDDKSNCEELQVQIRLAHLLFSTTDSISVLSSKISPHAMRTAKSFASSTPAFEKDWIHLMKSVGNYEIPYSQAIRSLIELTLKKKLREWLLEKVFEGCKTTLRDDKGQGVIHLCAVLGYTWAVYLFSCSGLSLDFRDAFGWTALHWAAYCGRERMVAFLLSAGANASLVTDPTSECPGGHTAADLASIKGYHGLAGYLAEKGLTQHFQAMSLSGNASGSLQANAPDLVLAENLNEDEQCLKDSLAAYRTAADAAARIQAALREQELKMRAKAVQKAKPEDEALSIISAMKIQHAYRNYNSRKRMAAAVRIQHSFRTWKIRREFLNMREQAIKIQAAYRGHLVRRQYKKILWSVGVLEKAVLRWRLKRKGLRGLQVEPTETVEAYEEQKSVVEEDFYQISRKHAEDRVERSVIRVQSMFRSHQAQKEYRRMKLAFDEAKLEYDELFYAGHRG